VATEYEFPAQPTRRERLLFEQHAGITMNELGRILADPARHGEVTAMIEAALLLVAVRRKRPDTTIDEVIDHDDWVLAEPAAAAEVDDSPLPSPTGPS